MSPPYVAMPCDCRVYGNQYGHWFRSCEEHGELITAACERTGQTPEEFLREALETLIARYESGR